MPLDLVDKFSSHLKNVLTRALCFVVEMNQHTIHPEHLLWALGTQKGSIGAELLKKAGVRQMELKKSAGKRSDKRNTAATSEPRFSLQLSDDAKRMVEKAVLTANVYGHQYVGTEHLLSGILQISSHTMLKFFDEQKINLKELRQQIALVLKSTSKFPEMVSTKHQTESSSSHGSPMARAHSEEEKMTALEYFSKELTSPAVQTSIDPVIGRENEIERVMEILLRRTKNNPLLLGEPGVGKTAIVEGLAKKIIQGQVPSALAYKRMFALDLTLVVAGTMYRGEFEGRLRQIIDEVSRNPDVILFIDELHTIIGAGSASGSMDAANILKPALAKGEIRCVGATTFAEYKKHIESDSALERRFQTLNVEEPSVETAISILQGVSPYYEQFHHVRMSPDAIEQAVKLSERFLPLKRLPDKAIDLLDEAAAAKRLHANEPGAEQERRSWHHKLTSVREQKRQAVVEEQYDKAIALKEKEEHITQLLEQSINILEPAVAPWVTSEDVARIVARTTRIPIEDILLVKQPASAHFEETLAQTVLGQSKTVHRVAQALKRAKTGISAGHRPLASFFFLGPSGVGKTELAKAVASVLFHDPKSLIRLDMSEYAEGFSSSKLIGSPPGYVGYKDQSLLTDQVKQRPYSVVLFDELEKAHRDVQHLLLQILEEGTLTDATGRSIDFAHTVIVMTSNVGLERFERGEMGFLNSEKEHAKHLHEDLRRELEDRFRPELLNRIDELCIFEPLSRETLVIICEKQLQELQSRLQEKQLMLRCGKGVSKALVSHIDLKLGARQIRQRIQQELESPIAETLLHGKPSRLFSATTHKGNIIVKAD